MGSIARPEVDVEVVDIDEAEKFLGCRPTPLLCDDSS